MKGECYVAVPLEYENVDSMLSWPRIGEGFTVERKDDAKCRASSILRENGLRYGVLAIIKGKSITFDCTVRDDGMYCPYITVQGRTAVQDDSGFDKWRKTRGGIGNE